MQGLWGWLWAKWVGRLVYPHIPMAPPLLPGLGDNPGVQVCLTLPPYSYILPKLGQNPGVRGPSKPPGSVPDLRQPRSLGPLVL